MELKDEFDLEFSLLMREIENYAFLYSSDKSIRIRLNNWIKKINQTSNNIEWKKNRNLHAINLLNMLINGRIEEPYNKNPSDGPLQILSKTLVKSELTYKFWESVKHIYNSTTIEKSKNKSNNASTKKQKNNQSNNNINIKSFKTFYNKKNNNNNNKKDEIKIKRVKTPKILNKNYSSAKNNKMEENIFKYKNELIKINIDNKLNDELKFLRETAIKLEEELNKNEEIIEIQNEENNALKKKIMKLTEILKTLI